MSEKNDKELYLNFDEYIRQGEPSQREAAYAWSTAIGLQAVDGLKTSEYLNDSFAKHSWYFRNALVRANYKNAIKGIDYSPVFLERFFRSMLLGEKHDLRNRIMHVNWGKVADEATPQSAKLSDELPPKCKNCTYRQKCVPLPPNWMAKHN